MLRPLHRSLTIPAIFIRLLVCLIVSCVVQSQEVAKVYPADLTVTVDINPIKQPTNLFIVL
jgi:hypothetical protein